MRRTLLYLLIALSAFGGGIVAFKYHLQKMKEEKSTSYIMTINRWIEEIEAKNKGFDELEKANDGDLITVQGFADVTFLCLDVIADQQNVCTTVLNDRPFEKQSLVIRLKVCDGANNSNCIVWKPYNLCEGNKNCSTGIRIYDDNSKPTDFVEEIVFSDGYRGLTGRPVQIRVTGKVSLEENKPKLLTPIETLKIIESQ